MTRPELSDNSNDAFTCLSFLLLLFVAIIFAVCEEKRDKENKVGGGNV